MLSFMTRNQITIACAVAFVLLCVYAVYHHHSSIMSPAPCMERIVCPQQAITREITCPPAQPPVVQERIVDKIVYITKPPVEVPPTTASKPVNPAEVQRNTNNMHYPLMLYEGFDNTVDSAQLVPHNEGAANIVYFVWCGAGRLFEFKHMLSVLSAIKIQQPLKVVLYHWPGKAPKTDLYNNWLDELQNTFYNFETTTFSDAIREPDHCASPNQISIVLAELLKEQGGIYMNENIVLRKPLNSYRWQNFVHLSSDGLPGIVAARWIRVEEIVRPTASATCTHTTKLSMDSAEPCVSMEHDKLYPRDIMTSETPFSELARLLFYGSTSVKIPQSDLSDPIPNIGHFYLLGDNTVNFFIYLSIVSMVNMLKVDAVYVHGDVIPKGDYWTKLVDTGKVKFIYCPPVQKVFGNAIDPGDKFHGKDILSVYFLYLYGGVFIDWDAIFTRPLDDAVRGYDAVMGFDWFIPGEAPTFPEVINPGVLAAKRHSVFISMWLEKYKDFGKKGGFYFTGLLVPYKLYEHYPETVKLDVKFQVICWQFTCHPPWMQGYQNEKFNSDFDWEQVYSVHFTYPDPREFYNEGNLKNATTMIGRMGQRVMLWN